MSHGATEDSAHWQAAIDHYQADRVLEAWDECNRYGIGDDGRYLRWYRVIEAEALTRYRSVVRVVTPWLRFEYVPGETQGLENLLVNETMAACDWVAKRLQWDHSSPTLVTLLTKECDTPWAVSPYGYCTDKNEFDKICLPDYLIDDLEEFRQAVAHEYAHVVSLGLSNGYAPRWVEEAVSVLVENELRAEALQEFEEEPETWLDAAELEMILSYEGEGDEDPDALGDEIWLAYQQSGLIGRYLDSLGSENLPRLLRAHADEGPLKNLRRVLRGRTRTDVALQECLQMDAKELFRKAYEHAMSLARTRNAQ